MTDSLPLGRYRHYKGNEYTVLGVARHSETREVVVVYRAEYGERGIWARPLEMFRETVTVAGQTVPRFQHVGASATNDTNRFVRQMALLGLGHTREAAATTFLEAFRRGRQGSM